MKFSKNWKRFWTLSRRSEGFTLVELIVVIAILAILAGVATAGYSGYIKKANMTADQTLVSEVKQALELGYYGGKITGNGYVVITADDEPQYVGDGVQVSLEDVYGSGLSLLRLKYADWAASYSGSSFAGNETQLLGKVNTLTGVLSDVLVNNPEAVGTTFGAYLSGLGIENTQENAGTVANAAVLYVAKTSSNLSSDQKNAVIETISGFDPANDNLGEMMGELNSGFGGNTVATTAALYALAEGYCQSEASKGNTAPLATLNNATADMGNGSVTSTGDAYNAVMGAFAEIYNDNQDAVNAYFSEGTAAQDANAYFDLMSTVSSAESTIVGNLSSDNCYGSGGAVENLFNAYSEGGVMVMIEVEGNSVKVSSTIDGQ